MFYQFWKFKLDTLIINNRPPGGGRLFDMKVVSSYVFLRKYFV